MSTYNLSDSTKNLLKNSTTRLIFLYKDGVRYYGIFDSTSDWGFIEDQNGNEVEILYSKSDIFCKTIFVSEGYSILV